MGCSMVCACAFGYCRVNLRAEHHVGDHVNAVCEVPHGPAEDSDDVAYAREELNAVVEANDLVVDGVHSKLVVVHHYEARGRHGDSGAAHDFQAQRAVRRVLLQRYAACCGGVEGRVQRGCV